MSVCSQLDPHVGRLDGRGDGLHVVDLLLGKVPVLAEGVGTERKETRDGVARGHLDPRRGRRGPLGGASFCTRLTAFSTTLALASSFFAFATLSSALLPGRRRRRGGILLGLCFALSGRSAFTSLASAFPALWRSVGGNGGQRSIVHQAAVVDGGSHERTRPRKLEEDHVGRAKDVRNVDSWQFRRGLGRLIGRILALLALRCLLLSLALRNLWSNPALPGHALAFLDVALEHELLPCGAARVLDNRAASSTLITAAGTALRGHLLGEVNASSLDGVLDVVGYSVENAGIDVVAAAEQGKSFLDCFGPDSRLCLTVGIGRCFLGSRFLCCIVSRCLCRSSVGARTGLQERRREAREVVS